MECGQLKAEAVGGKTFASGGERGFPLGFKKPCHTERPVWHFACVSPRLPHASKRVHREKGWTNLTTTIVTIMLNRLLVFLALLLAAAVWAVIQHTGRAPAIASRSIGFAISDPAVVSAPKAPLAGELFLVKAADPELATAPADQLSGQVADTAATNSEPAGMPLATVASEDDETSAASLRDGKEIKEVVAAETDGKEFKEIIDPKSLPPIAEGGGAEGGPGGGGGGGFGAGGRGGGPANEVAAFREVRVIEKEGDGIAAANSGRGVINRTIVRPVPPAELVIPVPEPGSAPAGFGVSAVVFAALVGRRRPVPTR